MPFPRPVSQRLRSWPRSCRQAAAPGNVSQLTGLPLSSSSSIGQAMATTFSETLRLQSSTARCRSRCRTQPRQCTRPGRNARCIGPTCACRSSGVGLRRRSSSASARCARRGAVRPHAVESASVVSGTSAYSGRTRGGRGGGGGRARSRTSGTHE